MITAKKMQLGLLTTALTLLASSVAAATNAPQQVVATDRTTEKQVPRFKPLISAQPLEQRYIVTFKGTDAEHLIAVPREKGAVGTIQMPKGKPSVGFDSFEAMQTLKNLVPPYIRY